MGGYSMNNGIQNEKNIIKYLNNKYFYELNNNMKDFLRFVYKEINNDDKIYALKANNLKKEDIIIIINNQRKNISVKTGSENSVHIEKISTFISFLKNNHVNDNIINYLKLYHYGDDTYNGVGKKRFGATELKIRYLKEILSFNKYISYDNLLHKIIDRFLFSGTGNSKVDYIYYGDENYGIYASKNEILDYMVNKKCYYLKTIHFSSLTYQNWCRNIDKKTKLEKRRYYIQIKWFSIVSDLQKIRRINNTTFSID